MFAPKLQGLSQQVGMLISTLRKGPWLVEFETEQLRITGRGIIGS